MAVISENSVSGDPVGEDFTIELELAFHRNSEVLIGGKRT